MFCKDIKKILFILKRMTLNHLLHYWHAEVKPSFPKVKPSLKTV